MEENIIMSDENLLNFFKKEELEDMASLFSNGNFQKLLNKYFYINNSTETEINQNNTNKEEEQTPQDNNSNNNNNQVNITPKEENKKEPEFNYQIFEKLLEDELSQQIVLTIVLFCFLKNKEIAKEVDILFEKYNYPSEDMIFPLIFLKIKYYIKSNNIPLAIDIINKLINKYEKYNMNYEEQNNLKNIYTIETFHQKFIYFYNLFNYLFNMNDIDSKIKKLYFELKSCYYNINCFTQAYKTILHLYQIYPEDFLIQFELAKDSVINSKLDVYKNIIEKMRKKKEEENEGGIKEIYNNYILYAEALSKIASNQYAEAKNKIEEILGIKKEENNIILHYNIGILDIYKTNLKEGHDKLVDIYHDKNNDNKKEYIKDTIKNIKDIFNIK